jgi:hypothetical protein
MLLLKINRKTLWLVLTIQAIVVYTNAQNLILNGSFENNLCVTYTETCSNHKYDSLMSNSHSFGTDANLDIMTSADSYCGSNGAAENGTWYVGVSSDYADAFSLTLSSTLIQGKTYSLSFYDRQSDIDTAGSPVQIGVSNNDSTMGTILFTGPQPATCQWQRRSFSFSAPANIQYITVTCPYDGPPSTTWTHVDNFVLDTGNTMGVKPINAYEYMQIFPNPANTKINIACSLYDVLGNEVISTQAKEIDVSNLSNGVYFLNVKTEAGVLSKKVVVQH